MVLAQLFKDSIRLTLKDKRVTALFLLVGIFSYFIQSNNPPSLIVITLLLFSIGWFGTKIALLYEVNQQRHINLHTLPHLLLQYLRRLLPAALLVGLIGVIGVTILFGLFAQWFFSRINVGDSATSEQFSAYFVRAIQDRQIWAAFLNDNLVIKLLVQLFAFALLITKIWVRAVVSFLVTETSSIKVALSKSFSFLIHRLDLIIAFLLLHTILAIILNIFNLLVVVNTGLIKLMITYLVVILQTYGMLILDGFVLLAVVRNHKPFAWIHSLFTSVFSLGAKLAHQKR